MSKIIYPGTFDPITRGHEDLIRRASMHFDQVVIAIATSQNKAPYFSLSERLELARQALSHYKNVEVKAFSGLLAHFMEQENADLILRGIRAVADFDYEFQMAGMNRTLMPQVETIFMLPNNQHQFISGTFVREIAQMGGDISQFVNPIVAQALYQKVQAQFKQ